MDLIDLLKSTRQYFWNLNFSEVEIPYLNSTLPLEQNIYSFRTVWTHSQTEFYLPTSPELALKKWLLESKKSQRDPIGGCFAISHCFRDLESSGPHHSPEFLMLEWYEVGKNYLDLMTSVENYLHSISNFPSPFPRITLPSNLPNNEPDFNQWFLNDFEPTLPQGPVFVTGYPAYLSPLAYSENGMAHRFELYINKIEIANGCTENRDPIAIQKAFDTEKSFRLKNHLPLHPYSTEFIDNCSRLPPCAGIGLGLERLQKLL